MIENAKYVINFVQKNVLLFSISVKKLCNWSLYDKIWICLAVQITWKTAVFMSEFVEYPENNSHVN